MILAKKGVIFLFVAFQFRYRTSIWSLLVKPVPIHFWYQSPACIFIFPPCLRCSDDGNDGGGVGSIEWLVHNIRNWIGRKGLSSAQEAKEMIARILKDAV